MIRRPVLTIWLENWIIFRKILRYSNWRKIFVMLQVGVASCEELLHDRWHDVA
jgi:hypothetical protein